jgi:hypothetical protein
MTVLRWHIHRLDGHDSAVHQARPDSEPDQAAMLQWVASSNEQKYA